MGPPGVRKSYAIWALLMEEIVEISIFPTSSRVSYTFLISDKEINTYLFENLRTGRNLSYISPRPLIIDRAPPRGA